MMGDVSPMHGRCAGHVSVMYWMFFPLCVGRCLGDVPAMCWVTSRLCLGDVSAMCLRCFSDVSAK